MPDKVTYIHTYTLIIRTEELWFRVRGCCFWLRAYPECEILVVTTVSDLYASVVAYGVWIRIKASTI